MITFWTWAQAFVYGARFWQGRWRSMRVIEHDALMPLDGVPDPQLANV